MSRLDRRDRRWGGPEVFGIVLILIGAFWLVGSLNIWVFSWALMWPLIVVAAGVALIFGSWERGIGDRAVAIPRDGVRRLELRLNMYGGKLRLAGGSAQLIDASSWRRDLRAELRRRDDEALVRLGPAGRGLGGLSAGADWQVGIPSDIPVAIRISAGAGEFLFDLSNTMLASANLSMGACHAELVLPRPSGDVQVRISAGASGIDLRMPPGADMRVSTSGLASINGMNQTPGYATARDRLTVVVTGGAIQVNVL